MSLRSILLACFFLWVNTVSTFAQADEANTKHLARFLSDQTMLVGKIDLTRIDVVASFDLLLGMKLPVHDELGQGKQVLSRIKASLLQAGAERLYLVYNQMEIFQWPTVYVPLKDAAQAETVASLIAHLQPGPFPRRPSWLTPGREAAWKVIDNYVVIGTASSVQAFADTKPVNRPAFQAASAALKDAPVQLLLLPTEDLRKVVVETQPQFPKELGGGSTAVISKGLQWANITASLPPQLQAQLIVATDQPSQAQELEQLWKNLLSTIKKETDAPTASTPGRAFYKLLSSINVKVQQRQFIIDATEQRLSDFTQLLGQTLPLTAADDLNARNLRDMVIAMHNYHNDFSRLPNQAINSKEGKPLLSWRVALLPYLGHDHLYKEFKYNEPWDSEHNKKLIEKMPKIYAHPFAKNVPPHHTYYQVFYSKKGTKPAAVFMDTGSITLGMLTVQDGTSNTFVVTDAAAEAVPWTKPADLLFDWNQPLPKMSTHRDYPFARVGFGDGSVRQFKPDGDVEMLKRFISRNDGKPVDFDGIIK